VHSTTDFVSFVTKTWNGILHSPKWLFLNGILFALDLGKVEKRLTGRGVTATSPSFPTKLSTDFVDKGKYPHQPNGFNIVSHPQPHKYPATR
jgi:hypothetical protein